MGGTSSRTGGLMTSKEASFVQETVKKNCVVIFSKTTCPYCHMAKRVFNNIGTPYEAVELNTRNDGHVVQGVLKEMTGSATVPQVFVNGKCIGGGTETKNLHQQGKLIPLLQQCDSTQAKL